MNIMDNSTSGSVIYMYITETMLTHMYMLMCICGVHDYMYMCKYRYICTRTC